MNLSQTRTVFTGASDGGLLTYCCRLLLVLLTLVVATSVQAADRSLVAVAQTDGGVYLSWRMLPCDDATTAFDVYRLSAKGVASRINPHAITNTTDFIDRQAGLTENNWFIIERESQAQSQLALKPQQADAQFIEINNGTSTHGRNLAIADLTGDGRLDYVLRYSAYTTDPYHSMWRASTSTYRLIAVDTDGKTLWQYDMGPAIEMGIWYSPYVVYDLDQDGKAELIVKSGGQSWSAERLRDESGRVIYGPEYVDVISGEDGRTLLARAPWPDRSGFSGKDPEGLPVSERRYEDYNRWSRNFIAIAYLDGVLPHLVVSRGTYGKHKVTAYRYLEQKLVPVWTWENQHPQAGGDRLWWGQGAHSLQAHDVDDDGKDEIVLGGAVLDDSGKPLWTLGKGHVDHVYVADIDPNNPGKELYYGSEASHSKGGIGLVDAATGAPLWTLDEPTQHIHKEGLCADLIAAERGLECYSGEYKKDNFWLFDAKGEVISKASINDSLNPLALYWDADEQKEVLHAARVSAQQPTLTLTLASYSGNNAYALKIPEDVPANDIQYLKPIAIADVLGDWREELLVVDRHRLLIYTTSIKAVDKKPWLMSMRSYRVGVVNSAVGYYQPPLAPIPSPCN